MKKSSGSLKAYVVFKYGKNYGLLGHRAWNALPSGGGRRDGGT